MQYQIETDDDGISSVTPLNEKTWTVTFNSPEAAKEAILTVSRIGKAQLPIHPLLAYGQAVQEQRLIPDYAID